MTVTATCPAPCNLVYTFDASRHPDPGRCALCSFRAAVEPELERQIAERFRAESKVEFLQGEFRRLRSELDAMQGERDAAKAEADAIRRRWMEEVGHANAERDAARKLTTDTIVAYAEERARFAEVVKERNACVSALRLADAAMLDAGLCQRDNCGCDVNKAVLAVRAAVGAKP